MLIPPHDSEAVAVGALLLDADRALELAGPLFRSEFFSHPKHRAVVEAALALALAGEPVDLVSVTDRCRSKVVSVADVAEMSNSVPTVENVAFHLKKLKEVHIRRVIAMAAGKAMEDAKEGSLPAEEIFWS